MNMMNITFIVFLVTEEISFEIFSSVRMLVFIHYFAN